MALESIQVLKTDSKLKVYLIKELHASKHKSYLETETSIKDK